MATNIPTSQQAPKVGGVIEGSFKGDLDGNAKTATALQNDFSVTLTGDATGSFTTHGNNTQLNIKVNKSINAENANHAKTADSVAFANTAGTSTYADTSGRANTAGSATTATSAKTAEHSLTSDKANSAELANTANTATHAEFAEEAQMALHADTASEADTAHALALDATVPYAERAGKAELATIAQFDCDGKSIKDFYAKKADIPQDALTIDKADSLYVKREEKLLQATVRGKAYGSGVVTGSALAIDIKSIDCGENNISIYDKIVFLETELLPTDPDTTKIYVTHSGKMFIYNQKELEFFEIKSKLDDKVANDLNEAISKLQSAVLTTGNQEIAGTKTFKEVVYGGIPSPTADNDKALATIHNVLDVLSKLDILEKDVKDNLTDLTNKVDAQTKGDLLFATVDYSQPENQALMTIGTRYLTLLTEQKEYIQINEDTNLPTNPAQVPFYYRYYLKSSKGKVIFSDYRISADLSDYARLDGATFTGSVKIPDVQASNLEELKKIKDTRALNSKQLNTLLDGIVNDTTAKLGVLMPKAGGDFTGNITTINQNDLSLAPNNTVLNKQDTSKLIDTNIQKAFQEYGATTKIFVTEDELTITNDGIYFVVVK